MLHGASRQRRRRATSSRLDEDDDFISRRGALGEERLVAAIEMKAALLLAFSYRAGLISVD